MHLELSDKEALIGLLDQLRDSLMNGSTDENLKRLFPTAYHQDPKHDEEYQRLMRDDLLASRLQSLGTATSVLSRESVDDTTVLTAQELDEFARSINNLRLVIGTVLDIDESDIDVDLDEDDPNDQRLVLYGYLGWLLDWAVTAQLDEYS
jgi:hypothetical protein